MNPMKTVKAARDNGRTLTSEWIALVFDTFIELHGDRNFGDDQAIIGGIAMLGARPVTVIGMEKGHDLTRNLQTNFGSVHPEGYRKSLRLMKQAEKFGRPIVTFVNTAGAFCGITAEERGIGQAIANNLAQMSQLQVPVICILTGEGGSGGALALAVANQVWILELAMYSILSPEGFASILWKDSSRAAEASKLMGFTSKELLEQTIVDQVIPEQRKSPEKIAQHIRKQLIDYLDSTKSRTGPEWAQDRYERFRKF